MRTVFCRYSWYTLSMKIGLALRQACDARLSSIFVCGLASTTFPMFLIGFVKMKKANKQGANNMSETHDTLAFFTQGWQNYQNQLSTALARLTPEQLALRAAPGLRSIEELALHVISCRAGWFHYCLKEGDEEFGALAEWGRPGSPSRPASELVSGLEKTWQVLRDVLGR
jgi:hypothetical protein